MAPLAGKKVLILYTAHTLGHQRVGENIGYWLGEGGAEVTLREVLKSNPSPFVKKFLKLHVWVNAHAPWLWAFLYFWGYRITLPFRLFVARKYTAQIKIILDEIKPDVVITTETAPSAVLSVLKKRGEYVGLWGITFSDYHFHRYWVYPLADFYLVNIKEQIPHLTKLGISQKRVHVIGLALPPRPVYNSVSVRKKLGIPEGARVLLVGSGSLGISLPASILEVLVQVQKQAQIRGVDVRVIVATGHNTKLLSEVQQLQKANFWLVPLPFYEPLGEIYTVSNVMLSKPGGLTIAETIQAGLPMLVTHYFPGQEELNLSYLVPRRMVMPLYVKPKNLWAESIVSELISGGQGAFMREHADMLNLVAPQNLPEMAYFIAGLFHENNL